MFEFNDDAVSTSDSRQPFHVVNGKIVSQQEWNTHIFGGLDEK